MTEATAKDRQTKKYWDNRVLTHKDQKRMIWYGQEYKFDTLTRVAEIIMSMFQNCKVLDVGCGYGRMAHIFKPENYLGIDISKEIIKLAKEKEPNYKFEVQDINDYELKEEYEVIFEVMCFGMSSKYKDIAKVAHIIIQPGKTEINFTKELS